jgi:hypothetical protein
MSYISCVNMKVIQGEVIEKAEKPFNICACAKSTQMAQPRSQGFSLFVIGKAGKGPGISWSHDLKIPTFCGYIGSA